MLGHPLTPGEEGEQQEISRWSTIQGSTGFRACKWPDCRPPGSVDKALGETFLTC
jgi:hypothetical protein